MCNLHTSYIYAAYLDRFDTRSPKQHTTSVHDAISLLYISDHRTTACYWVMQVLQKSILQNNNKHTMILTTHTMQVGLSWRIIFIINQTEAVRSLTIIYAVG